MGARGPKPRTTAEKKRRGNPGRRPLNDAEPKPKIKAPKCPSHLSTYAKREWARVAPMLVQLTLMTELDKSALMVYCEAYATWRKATLALEKSGLVVVVRKKTKTDPAYEQASPWLSIQAKAEAVLNRSFAHFGLTPSARTNIKVDMSLLAAMEAQGYKPKKQTREDILAAKLESQMLTGARSQANLPS